MKKAKKLISLLLALVMLLSMIPMAVAADDGTIVYDGVTLYTTKKPTDSTELKGVKGSAITKNVGENGVYQRLPRDTNIHTYCNTVIAEFIPEYYAASTATVELSDPTVLSDFSYTISGWQGNDEYKGKPCLTFNFTAAKSGTTTVKLTYYYNYNHAGETGYCNGCGRRVSYNANYLWYKQTSTFTVTVGDGEVPTPSKPDKPTESDVNNFFGRVNSTSTSKGAVYMWCDTYDHHAWFSYITDVDDAYTLGEVVANDGTVLSKGTYPWVCVMTLDANKYLDAYNSECREYGTHYLKDGQAATETATWYWNADLSKWQFRSSEAPIYIDITHTAPTPEVTEYTVTYKDGVDGAAFADQTYTVKEGDATPAFKGTPTRTGYKFLGWNPEVAKTVTVNATYTAKWEKVESVDKPTTKPSLSDRCYVRVQCVNTDAGHTLQYLDLLPSGGPGRYTEDTDEDGNVYIEKDGVWTYTITLNRAKFIESFCDSTHVNKAPHTDLNPDQVTKMSWTWNAKQKLWKLDPVSKNLSTVGALIEVKCDLHSVAEHTVTFDSYGGSHVDPQEVEYGRCATEPEDPTLKGYTFAYWYLDDENEAYDFENTPVTADITLTAKWEINKYTVTYDFRKVVKTSDVKNLNNPTTFTIEDLPLTLKAPTFKNNEWPQKFLNWRDADGNVVTEITEPGDITLCAYYQFPVRYRVYDEDGKEVEALTVIDWYNEDDFASYEVRPATVDMPGYELDGWYQTLKDAGNVNKRFGSLYMAKKYELVGKLNCCINVTVEVNGETVSEQKFTGAKGGTPDYRSLYRDIVISAVADGSLVEYATYIDGERSTGTLPVFGTNANVKIVITTASIG